MLKEKVIDTHWHVEAWENDKGDSYIDYLEQYRQEEGLSAVNIAALPSGEERNVSNNIMLAFYKLANKNSFAHGGLVYPSYPAPDPMPVGMDFVTQYKELMEIGFDGIKMLEGKPSLHKLVGKDLSCDLFDSFFAELEKDKTHLLFHVNDPEEFWDINKAPKDAIENGWFYGNGDYASNEEVYNQINRILAKHPNLNVNFAHFFFYSFNPCKLEEIFAKYPNVGVDLTPGWEMYRAFDESREYYMDFFVKYSQRIQLGTDTAFPWPKEDYAWLLDRVYRYIATDDEFEGFGKVHKGMKLPKEALDNILYKNFERTVSSEPKTINKEALKKYIEKYDFLMTENDRIHIKALSEKYL